MPFITQGKTNWKFLLIVIILAVIVAVGASQYSRKLGQPYQPPEIKKPEKIYNLTLKIKQEIYPLELFPLPTTVSVYRNQLPFSPLVDEKEAERNPNNLKEAIIKFNLPAGRYVCIARFVVDGYESEGDIDVELNNDMEKDLIINITPPP